MAGRTYAQIECSLTGSKKFRSLSSSNARCAYLCAHLSDYGTYTGLYQYPRHIWSHDVQLSPPELDAAIEELVTSGLVQFDPEDDYVRIVGWFHKRSGPDNPNRIKSVIADLSGMDDVPPEMLMSATAELTVASVKRALKWKEDGAARDQLNSQLTSFLNDIHREFGDEFLAYLSNEAAASSATVRSEIGVIFPLLLMQKPPSKPNPSGRVTPTLSKHEDETRRDVDEMETKKDEEKNETAQELQFEDPSQPSPHLADVTVLRKVVSPSTSALNSSLAKAARGA